MANDQTNLKQMDFDAGVLGTPSSKDDKKREATSPLYQDVEQQKKTRHDSDSSSTSSHADGAVHLLSQPINPFDIVQIAAELRSLMLPELKSLLRDQIPEFKSMVVDAVKEATDNLNEQVRELQEENTRLTKENQDLDKRLSQVERDNDSLEQYSRRNSIRIAGFPEVANEDTDDIVLKIAQELDTPISPSDIDRSHRIGKIVDQGRGGRSTRGKQRHRDILVKFATYNARQRLFLKRKELRDMDDMKHLFLNEDLTKIRSKLLYDARCLVRAEKLKTAYAYDGRIFVRDNDETRQQIQTDADLSAFGDPKEAREELARKAGPPAALRSSSAEVSVGAQPMVS